MFIIEFNMFECMSGAMMTEVDIIRIMETRRRLCEHASDDEIYDLLEDDELYEMFSEAMRPDE